MTDTEKLAVLQKVRLLALGAMQTLNPADKPEELDEDLYGIWLEFQSAWMTTQDAYLKFAVGDMEADKNGD